MGRRVNHMSHPGGLAELQARLDCNDKGTPRPHVGNVLLCLALDPTLAGLFGYSEFEEEVQVTRPPPPLNPSDPPFEGPYPRQVRKADVVVVAAYIQRAFLAAVNIKVVEDACYTEAFRNRFHPVREWLASLRWDGTHRLDTWLCRAFGAPDTPYIRAVGAKTLIASVRRVRQPGCKFDTMPVLEGGQGIGKSRCVRRLYGPDWFTDSMPPDLKAKDGMMAVLGVWCIEFAEIEHLIRTDPETMKAFLSRPVERFRSPYERGMLRHPRQCVFIGTTNATDYLRDATGNRRIWPIACEHADEDWVAQHRTQLWAEAAMREASGEILWLEEDARDEATEAQDDRIMEDPWAAKVRDFLDGARLTGQQTITVPDVLAAIGLATKDMNKSAEMRVALILSREGLRKKPVREGKRTRKVWLWPE